jgi:SAM-dependent methyltransferase
MTLEEARERTKQIQAEFAAKGDVTGWFEALYTEADGDLERIPWADLEPNPFFVEYAESRGLKGNGRGALVVGCGLGDEARYLDDLGFDVTAFDISPTAIDWAKQVSADRAIGFVTADLFEAPREWIGAFDFVLEIYTIQPLPLAMRDSVIDRIAAFVAPGGSLVVVTRGRDDDEETNEVPWPLSRRDLSRFETHGLKQASFDERPGSEDPPIPRFVVSYSRPIAPITRENGPDPVR